MPKFCTVYNSIMKALTFIVILEVFEIRMALEPLALKYSFLNSADTFKDDMARSLQLQREACHSQNYGDFLKTDMAFHYGYINKCQNIRLMDILKNVWCVCERLYVYSLNDDDLAKSSLKDHERILEAINRGDLDESVKTINMHNMKIMNYYLHCLSTIAY